MRIDNQELYKELIFLIAKKSACLRRQVGAIIMSDSKHILSYGYNGPPKGHPHCEQNSCLRNNVESAKNIENCYASHAEMNAIAQAAYEGIKIKNSTLYCTHKPCTFCLKACINAGIKEIIYYEDYPDKLTDIIANNCNIKLTKRG